MKYIKTFESIESNIYYKVVNYIDNKERFSKDIIDITDSSIERLSNSIKFNIRKGNDYMLKDTAVRIKQRHLTIDNPYRQWSTFIGFICEMKDEYYIFYHNSGKFYICDQIYGLLQCLEDSNVRLIKNLLSPSN